MKYQFKNGAKVEGTLDQILTIAKTLSETVDLKKIEGGTPKGYYPSETKGIIKISEMHATHIKNALLKESKSYYVNLGKEKINDKEFLNKYIALGDQPLVVELVSELIKRK